MKKTNKTKLIAMAMAAICSCASIPQYAFAAIGGGENIVSPLYIAITKGTTSLSRSGSTLSCYGATTVSPGYKAGTTVILQVQNGSDWDDVTSWSASANLMATIEKPYTATQGNTYRLMTSHYAYNSSGNLIEMDVTYSSTVSY